MKLYCAPGTISLASAYLLEEAALPYTPVLLSIARGEQTASAYLALNPKGRVPTLVTDAGILTETGAIAEYIAAQVPERGLVPADAWAAAQMRAVTYYLAATFHVNHAHKHRGYRWADSEASFADMTAKVPETMGQSCAYLEKNCALSPFVMGEAMTAADPWLFTICTWLESDGVDIAAYPKLAAHFEMMNARPPAAALRGLGLLT